MSQAMRRLREPRTIAAAFLLTSTGLFGCLYQAAAHDEARNQAHSRGKYRVTLSTDRERIGGHCKFVRAIIPDADPVRPPTAAELPDYFRVEGVLLGADTVLIDGRVGEAYICGPGPLNPDGSLLAPLDATTPTHK